MDRATKRSRGPAARAADRSRYEKRCQIGIGLALNFVAFVFDTFSSLSGTTKAAMCRNIKTLFNFEPPATEAEIRDASLQFVRKICGFTRPSKANELAFERAVEEVTASARALIQSLVTTAEPRNRESESEKLRARSALRFGPKQ